MSFSSSSIVLVTGANGHVAQHVVSQLLLHPSSPKVRATVRSASSRKPIEDTFASYIQSGRLELVQVSDITAKDAYDAHISGITHIAHVASPLGVEFKDVENELLKPAIYGTTVVLEAAAKSNLVESVVITGSFASVFDAKKAYRPGYTYSPKDWNPTTYEEVATELDLTKYPTEYRPYVAYMASKAIAEKAAWDFYERTKPKWRLNVMLPTWIGGPNVLPLYRGTDGLSISQKLIWQCAVGKELPSPDFPFWVDVRDVAAAHIASLERETVNKSRFLMGQKLGWYAEIADIVRKNFPHLNPPQGEQNVEAYNLDISALESLGVLPLIKPEKMVVDTVAQIQKNLEK